ncbi:hypothetical protein [Lactobacillus kefiranofaciens]|uniref:hypothetical protein n=1 Tax=Lactobacillus kefiranofaciens TaxID=267818 RepID=UPI001FB91088|nr:hypothetical protein [Lactobacillus kefiranofaciens]MCJ2172521.1 hypothetical protein [Lactobacillus kefiranofaciens]MDF4142861.1 hypothetical protein [Lactobacillus kefiranofaciens]
MKSTSQAVRRKALIKRPPIYLMGGKSLTTAKTDRWKKPQNVMRLLIFALIFVAIIIDIPLYFAYRDCKKAQ